MDPPGAGTRLVTSNFLSRQKLSFLTARFKLKNKLIALYAATSQNNIKCLRNSCLRNGCVSDKYYPTLPFQVTTHMSRARTWCFTENNEPEAFIDILQMESPPPGVRYLCGQLERAETGHLHFQGYVELDKPQRISWLKANLSPTAHFETRFGTRDEARNYCLKEDTRIDGPWEFGTWETQQGKRNDIKLLHEALKTGTPLVKISNDFHSLFLRYHKGIEKYISLNVTPRDPSNEVENIVFVGETGCGKTRLCQERWPDAYWKPSQNKWFDGYCGQETIIFDDHNNGWLSWDQLMRVLDRYPCKVETKGGMVELQSKRHVFTSNYLPNVWYKSDKCQMHWPALKRRLTYVYMWSQATNNFETFRLD